MSLLTPTMCWQTNVKPWLVFGMPSIPLKLSMSLIVAVYPFLALATCAVPASHSLRQLVRVWMVSILGTTTCCATVA